MNKIIFSLLTVLLINCCAGSAVAWNLWGDDKPLLTINDSKYQIKDYLNWWHEWRESDELPQTADDYIDWLLLAGEAEQMQLQDQPSYQDKIATFLKVRSLMLLKKEEVDDKIVPADDKELHKIYLRDYMPRWQLRTVTFNNHEDLNLFLKAHEQSPQSSTEDIIATLGVAPEKLTLSSIVWQRPNNLPETILALLQQTKNHRFSAPYPWNNTWQLIEVISTQVASDDDYAKLRHSIADNNFKKQQNQFTAQLLNKLRDKYPVKINEELLADITVDGVPEGHDTDTVLELLTYKITAAQLYQTAKKQYDSFAPQRHQSAAFTRVLHQVLNGIITQNLTNTEALSRNYQLRPPLQSTFDFYRKHRLIRELEKQLILPAAQISEQEIKQAYDSRRQQMAGPSTVEILRAETTDAQLAERLHEKMRQGEDFLRIISVLGHTQSDVEQVPLNHLSAALQKVLQRMQNGEDEMVSDQGTFTFIKLFKTQHQQIVSYEEIKSALSAQLKQKAMRKKRLQILQQLRNRSQINIDQQQWQKCLDQLRKEA